MATITASRNKAGSYFKARAGSAVPATPAQLAQQAVMSTVRGMWSGLTAAQRSGWKKWGATVHLTGKLGRPMNLSGQNAFVASNMLRGQAGLGYVLDAPTVAGLAPWPVILIGTVDGFGNINLLFYAAGAPTVPGSGDVIFLSMSAAQGIGARAKPSKLLFGGLIDSYLSMSTVVTAPDVPAKYVASYPQQQYLQLRRLLPDGRYSQPVLHGPMDTPAPPIDPGWYIEPWEVVVDPTGVGADKADYVYITSFHDPGPGYAGLTFSLAADGQTILATTSGAAPGVYNTILSVVTTGGVSLLTTQITIQSNPYGLALVPWYPTVTGAFPAGQSFTNGSLFYVDWIETVYPYGVFWEQVGTSDSIEGVRTPGPAGVFGFYMMMVGDLGTYMFWCLCTVI